MKRGHRVDTPLDCEQSVRHHPRQRVVVKLGEFRPGPRTPADGEGFHLTEPANPERNIFKHHKCPPSIQPRTAIPTLSSMAAVVTA